ncbi:type II/IV secretion system ATPase subunit [archaeon]|nr:type II/IV secretion system ATPase subunit [archaeon]MBT4352495.1 type II/IV secretion system ATPase subunit [archaeon]MBT4647194.1 type II/IV secretion system ATPase subunit [archaeon]MBT6822197.1 type II/IV secretion system ATPase subunit [archaeon]MBT7391728.1 type II/IV secretion system ATPase subunit [archaeon]
MAEKKISNSQEPEYSIDREGEDNILRADYTKTNILPSIEDNPLCMSMTIEKLAQSRGITKVIFSQKREFEYEYEQTEMLNEIAKIYLHLTKEKSMLSYQGLTFGTCKKFADGWYNQIQSIIFHDLIRDPLGAYVELTRLKRNEKIILEKTVDKTSNDCIRKFIFVLDYILGYLENTKIVIIAKPYLAGYDPGEREVYRRIFSPIIKPDFMFTKLMATYPKGGEEIANYTIANDTTEVTVFRLDKSVQTLYHIMPPEFRLDEEKYELLDAARKIMAEHKPKRSEFIDPQRMREVFFNVGRDLIEELSAYRNMLLREEEIENLTSILVRYTVGFGLIEVLLQDQEIQDVSINSPMGHVPIFIVHGKFDDCKTNIIPTTTEAESWASKLRMISGRPLDEANPILDTELELPGASTRVSAVSAPLNPTGLAYSFRRHRDKPWTLPLFMKYKMINALGAGLLSFVIDGTRTLMICGTRSSGKSSFLSSLLVEIMRRYRIITLEDTLELPVSSMRNLGFNIQSLKVASALSKGTSEVDASDGIRSTLRLGDSSLIIGEVRSKEAIALYEAMRIGAAANVVAGTIHADSPYGLYDRVVNDIGVPKTSFKATDLIVIASPIKSADGLHKFRRITQITEVRKKWENDPMLEGGFMDLMKYDAKLDELVPTDELINGESEILKIIAGGVADFAGNWDMVWNNVLLRTKMKQKVFDLATKHKDDDMLEAPFVILTNDKFHLFAEKVKTRTGILDYDEIYREWEMWILDEVKRRQISRKSTS